jgi:hypothetical protein
MGYIQGFRHFPVPVFDKIIYFFSGLRKIYIITGINQTAFRMTFEVIHLLLKFVRTVPVIVPFAKGDVLPPAGFDVPVVIFSSSDILIRRDYPYGIRVPSLIFENDLPCPVDGAVLPDHQFKKEIGSLF